jgi:hypothetical protein
MSEITKVVGQWIVNNWGWAAVIFLFILSLFFKITKIELDPIGAIFGWIGKKLTQDVKKDITEVTKQVSKLENSNKTQFEKIEKDRGAAIKSLKEDYNKQIDALRTNLDGFEQRTDKSIDELKEGTAKNCENLKTRLDEMEASNQKSNDLQTVRQIRAHILDFANSCMNKREHTKSEFETIIDENTQYEELVEKYKIRNDVYKEDYAYIMDVYHKLQKEGGFLNEKASTVKAQKTRKAATKGSDADNE